MSREDAYAAVQRNAAKVWDEGADFLSLLVADGEVADHLDQDALRALFDLGVHTAHVDTIFARVFGTS
jgi:adenylosuccinate lyase